MGLPSGVDAGQLDEFDPVGDHDRLPAPKKKYVQPAMTFLTLDLETVPQVRYLEPDLVVPSDRWLEDSENLRAFNEPALFRAAVARGEVALAQTDSLPATHPSTAHVVQCSLGWTDEANDVHIELIQPPLGATSGILTAAEYEPTLLTRAFTLLHRAISKRAVLVTFNGKSFDIPMLRIRAAALALDVERLPWRKLLYPYSEEHHCDLRNVLGNDNRYAHGTLKHWSDAFGIHSEEHGADVLGWVREGQWGELQGYGQVETHNLIQLYERLRRFV